MSDDILTEFIEDAREHLEIGGQHLLRLEKDPSATEDMHGLLRSLHTIKGNAGFLDLNSLYSLLHKAENILQTIREQSSDSPKAVPAGLIDVMFQVLDTVEAMLGNLSSGKGDHVDWLERLIKSIDDIDATLNEDPGQLPTSPLETAPQETPQKKERPTPPNVEAVRNTVAKPVDKVQPNESEAPDALLENHIDLFLKHLGEELDDSPAKIKKMEKDLELIRVDVDLWARPEALSALNLIRDYLAECHIYGRPVTGTTRELMVGLAQNLKAWLGLGSHESNRAVILELNKSDLDLASYNLVDKIKRLKRQGAIGVAFDLRLFEIIRSSEIGVLITAFKEAPDPKKVGLIINPDKQSGLFRILRTMALDKTFRIFGDTEKAKKELAA